MLLKLTSLAPSAPIAATVCCVCSVLAAGGEVAGDRRAYDLPAGDAARMLGRFGEVSGRHIIFMMDKVRGERTQAVRGEYAAIDALRLMLAGTALFAVQDDTTGAIVVSRRRTDREAGKPGEEGRESEKARAPPDPSAQPSHEPTTKQPEHIDSPPVKKRHSFFSLAGRHVRRILLTGLLLPSTVFAQNPPDQDAEEIVVLSPFIVDGSGDDGYVAANTLAGTRLNSSLRNTPAPVSVFTQELLADLGANTMADAALFALNTTGFDEREIGDQTGNQLQNDGLQFSVRGWKATTARNYFEWGLNADNYNTTRLDLTRGPNALLFGIGSPGGIVNTTTKQAIFKDVRALTLQAASHGSFRVAADVNFALKPDVLAFRVNALKEDAEGWRRTQFKDAERLHLAATLRPFRSTTLRAEYEGGDIEQLRPRPWGPLDGFSSWEAAGSLLIPTARGPRPAGTSSMSSSTRLVVDQGAGDGALLDWRLMGRSNPLGNNYAIFDFDRVPADLPHHGPGNVLKNEYDTWSIHLEQRIGKDLFIEAAFNRQEQNSEETRVINWNSALYVDVNQQLPTGAPNPNVGRFFVEENLVQAASESEQDTYRLSASYNLDLGRILGGTVGKVAGRHQIGGLLQETDSISGGDTFRESNLTPFEQVTNIANAVNRIYRRTYLNLDTPEGLNGAIDPRGVPLAPQTIMRSTGQTGFVTPGMARVSGSQGQTKVRTSLVAAQSSFWDERIVTTVGFRRDSQKSRNARTVTDLGLITDVILDTEFADPRAGDTFSRGIVFRVSDWMRLVYNTADNFRLASNRYNLFGQQLLDEKGEGEDYGVRFSFLDNRLNLTASRYETAGRNRVTFVGTAVIRDIANLVWDVLDPSQRISTSLQPGATDSVESEGYEFEVVANPTRQWSVMANFSITEVKVADVAVDDLRYIDTHRDYWLASGATPVPGSSLFTNVSEAVAEMDENYQLNSASRNGLLQRGNEKYKGNLFTTYRFGGDGWMKGLSFGGGVRYRSGAITGYTSAGEETYAQSTTMVDLRAGYRSRLHGGKIPVTLALNVRNALDEDGIRISITNAAGEPQRYVLLDPREFQVTATFEF